MTDPAADAGPLAQLRQQPENPHGFRGFGPLLAFGVLLVLMVLLAPTVAPEQIVLVPTDESTTSTTGASTTTSTSAPSTASTSTTVEVEAP